MKKFIISTIFVITFSYLGLGFDNPEGVAILSNSHFMTGFYLLVISGLAGIGLIDLVNRNEGVSRD